MSQDEFTKLFKYLSERFDQVDQKLMAHDRRFDDLFSSIDHVLKRQEISDDERLVMGHQLERLDRWTHELAKKIGYTLSA